MSEHYFQAQKFAGTPYLEEIRAMKTPREAANKGRDSQSAALRSHFTFAFRLGTSKGRYHASSGAAKV